MQRRSHGSRLPLADTERNDAVRARPRPLRMLSGGVAAAAAAVLLAACGQGSDTVTTGSGGGSGSNATIATRDVQGAGTVLVDSKGMTVYFADQEAGGKVQCTEDCLGFWHPVTVSDGATPTADGDLPQKLGTVKRPDNGQTQVTYNGKLLYTFKLDQAAGDAQGNGAKDDFGGTSFVWHAIDTQGAAAKTGSGDNGYGGGGYGGY